MAAAGLKPKGKQIWGQFKEAQKRKNELDNEQEELKKNIEQLMGDRRILEDVSNIRTRILEAERAPGRLPRKLD